MSYEDKLEQAREKIQDYNNSLPEGIETVNIDKFITNLKREGGTTDEGLRMCSWENLKEMGLPTLLAKQIANVFRGKETERPKVITSFRAQAMTVEELVAHYDPRATDSPVSERLKKMTSNSRCIVFNEDGSVHIEISSKLVQDIRDGYPEVETWDVNGRPQKVYRIGERPDQMADVNPLFPEEVLRPGSVCGRSGENWESVSHEARVLVYLAARETGEIAKNLDPMSALHIIKAAKGENAVQDLRHMYRQASLLYDRMAKEDRLPSLRRSLNASVAASGKANDPWYNKEHKSF